MSSAKRNVLDIRKERKAERARAKAHAEMEPLIPERGGPRPLRLKDRRRRQRIIYVCAALLGTAALVGGLGAVSHVDHLALKSVTVFGAQELSTDALIAAVEDGLDYEGFQFFSKKNMFLYPREGIEQSLFEGFPRIKEVHIKREALLSQAVIVKVEEREPHALWCTGNGAKTASSTPEGQCYFLDTTGYIFAPEESLIGAHEPQLPYVFRGGMLSDTDIVGQYFLRGRLYDAVSFLKKVRRAGFTPLGLTVVNEKDFSVPLLEGPDLHVPFDADSTEIISRLESALAAEGMREKLGTLEYIDLRFGNRVYYK